MERRRAHSLRNTMSTSLASSTNRYGVRVLIWNLHPLSENLRENKGYHLKLSSAAFHELDTSSADDQEFTAFADAFVDAQQNHNGVGLVLFDTEEVLYVCNPLTQQFLKLPDPSPSEYTIENYPAFGYFFMKNEYKIARLFKPKGEGEIHKCEIYTLKENGEGPNCWRVIEETCSYPIGSVGVMGNGAFHWMIDLEFYEVWPDEFLVVSLDPETETFSTLPPPPNRACADHLDGLSLATLRGSLCLADNIEMEEHLQIWMLKDLKNKIWVKEFNIYVPPSAYDKYALLFPVYLAEDGQMLLHNDEESSLILCDTVSQTVKRVRRGIRHCPAVYSPSLMPLG